MGTLDRHSNTDSTRVNAVAVASVGLVCIMVLRVHEKTMRGATKARCPEMPRSQIAVENKLPSQRNANATLDF